MKTLLLFIFAFLNVVLFGQDSYKKIKKLKTVAQATEFIKTNPTLNAEIIELNSNTDSSAIAKTLLSTKPENTIDIDGYTYKVIEPKTSLLMRASYINLLGSKFSLHQIDSLRKVIITKYNNGVSFIDLAKQYNSDGNPTCDLGWFSEELMLKEFSSAVKAHNKGEVFTIDINDKMWYYVVLKTFDDRKITTCFVLKVKSN